MKLKLMTTEQKVDARKRIAFLRKNLQEVANAIYYNRIDHIDSETIIELRGDLEQLLEDIGRADG